MATKGLHGSILRCKTSQRLHGNRDNKRVGLDSLLATSLHAKATTARRHPKPLSYRPMKPSMDQRLTAEAHTAVYHPRQRSTLDQHENRGRIFG